MASPPSATGSMCTRKPPKVARLQIPTSMFCGLPVTESTEPTFEPMASPMRYTLGRTPRGRSAARRTGVTTRQTVSLTKNAESKPPPTTTAKSSRPGDRARSNTSCAAHSKNHGDEEISCGEDQETGGHENAECGVRNAEWIGGSSRPATRIRDRTCPFNSALRIPHSAFDQISQFENNTPRAGC